MLALKSLVAVCAFTLLIHPAMAANDASGNAGNGANSTTCARPTLTPEQRAERRALREQRLAQGVLRLDACVRHFVTAANEDGQKQFGVEIRILDQQHPHLTTSQIPQLM